MGLVSFSGIAVTEIVGKVGGSVFQRNGAGSIVRNKVSPTNPQTAYQDTVRANFETVVEYWATLSQSEQEAWIAAAATTDGEYVNKLGETQNYSGEQYFIQCNLSAYDESFPITAPPTRPSLTTPTLDSAVVTDIASIEVTFSAASIAANETMLIFATTSLSTGINRPRGSLFKLIQKFDSGDFSDTLGVSVAYNARFGAPVLGKKVFFGATLLHNPSGARLDAGKIFGIVEAG